MALLQDAIKLMQSGKQGCDICFQNVYKQYILFPTKDSPELQLSDMDLPRWINSICPKAILLHDESSHSNS